MGQGMKNLLAGMLLAAMNLGATVKPVPNDKADWAATGRSRFEECEFKNAARAFTKALQFRPNDANLHLWLGRSYERMAEVSGPLHAAGNARQARRSLERAVDLEPRNPEYLRELFDFYLDSPQWFRGGLQQAALLVERIAPDDPGQQAFLRVLLTGAQKEYHGADWRARQATLVPSSGIGRVIH
jgi:tetratricopeptide (TPR) repeat protein